MRAYLRALRTEENESMLQVAVPLGITRQYYEMIESGERKKSMDVVTLCKLAEHFGVSVNYLLEEELKWASNLKKE